VAGTIIFGSAAYETGNILGAVAGLEFIVNVRPELLVLSIGSLAFLLLLLPSVRNIAHVMGYVVIVMGISFLGSAIVLKPDIAGILKGSFVPSIPAGNGTGILVLGLIGTTVVPYNLFLGSGLSKKLSSIREMRIGLSIAIILGGIISIAVMVVGSFVESPFSFEGLVSRLNSTLGIWATVMFGLGMFAAGFSSSVTAPLASAMTAESLFSKHNDQGWNERSKRFKFIWALVLVIGVVLGMVGFKPIPAIILAQALNGLILPFISILLVLVVNDPGIIGKQHLNSFVSNVLLMIVVYVTLLLGISNIINALKQVLPEFLSSGKLIWILNIILSSLIWIYVAFQIKKSRLNH
jgi:Mn2+/Fe2+ NRAMP family transporter